MSDTEVLHQLSSDDPDSHTPQSTSRHGSEAEFLIPISNQDTDQMLSDESDTPLALATQASLEDFEVTFGPSIGDDDDADQDATLPWTPDDLDSQQV